MPIGHLVCKGKEPTKEVRETGCRITGSGVKEIKVLVWEVTIRALVQVGMVSHQDLQVMAVVPLQAQDPITSLQVQEGLVHPKGLVHIIKDLPALIRDKVLVIMVLVKALIIKALWGMARGKGISTGHKGRVTKGITIRTLKEAVLIRAQVMVGSVRDPSEMFSIVVQVRVIQKVQDIEALTRVQSKITFKDLVEVDLTKVREEAVLIRVV